ncbi:MAG: hypothetical protein RBU29_07770, partial [bacterium]|nr:hypothetical protein [bacterium]
MNQDKPLFVLPVLTRDDGGFLLLLAAVTLFLLGPIVTGGLPLDEDSLLFYYPLRVLHSDPAVGLWNPYQFCGFPRDGNPQSQLLYFPNLLLQFLPLSLGFRLLLVGHYLLGGVLFFLLLRGAVLRPVSAFFGALLFITGTFWRCKIVNLGLLEGIAWMPGVLFFFLIGLEHRFWIAYLCAALFFAMVMLAGMPHPTLYGLLLLVLITFSLWWRRGCTLTEGLAALVLTVGPAMCLAAGMILPAWLYLGETMRGPLSLEEALAGALPWQDLWKVFLGGLSQPRIMRLEPWEGTCAIGATGLFFTLWGWRAIPARLRLGLVLASLFACLSALGAQGGLATLLYHYLPGWDRLNMPNRALMLCALVLPIFGAYGLNWWLYQRQKTRLQAHILAALGGLALAGYAVAAGVNTWVWKTTLNPGLTSEVFLESISSSEWALYSNLLWLGLSLVLLALLDRFRWCLWLLFGLVLLQSCQFNARLYLETTDSSFYTKPKTVAQIQSFQQYKPYDRVMSYEPSIDFENDVRVWHIKPAVVPRFSEIYALSEIQGYDPLFPRRYAELVRAWAGQAEDSDARRRIRLTQLPRRMLDLLGIRYVIGHANSQFVYKGEGKLGEPGTYRIPCPSENAVQSFAIRWLMRDAVHLPQGETVSQLHCKKDGVTVETF